MEVIKKEVSQEKQAEELGEHFVPNGSCDRFGKLRQNVGGRPKQSQKLKVSRTNPTGGSLGSSGKGRSPRGRSSR